MSSIFMCIAGNIKLLNYNIGSAFPESNRVYFKCPFEMHIIRGLVGYTLELMNIIHCYVPPDAL